MMRIIFFGTSQFAVPVLEELLRARDMVSVVGVVTKPDTPQGRGLILASSPVKYIASRHELLTFDPPRLKENTLFFDELKKLEPDLAVVVSYGKIIPPEILGIPRYGFVNIHPSLLPLYRGPAPLEGPILNGDQETGVTLMLLDEEMDHGPIAEQESIPLKGTETALILRDTLSTLGARMLIELIPKFREGTLKLTPQDHTKATYTSLIRKEDGKIDWKKSAETLEREIRAYNDWPGSYTFFARSGEITRRILKVLKASVVQDDSGKKPGTILHDLRFLVVQTGDSSLALERVKPEGKRDMNGLDFLRGHQISSFE